MRPCHTAHSWGSRGMNSQLFPLATSIAPKKPGSFTPNAHLKKLSCLKCSSVSVS